ncbi:MAG: hypothetical protein JXB13_03625 [Phycisphaerae bacterium]|nr:hypothetical protein [Phycisphaerae bacterium]
MRFRSGHQRIRRPAVTWGLLLTWAMVATAWADPPTTQPAVSPAAQTPKQKADEPAPKPGTPAQVREPAGRTPKPAPQGARAPRSEYPPDPNAKWACDKTEVVLEPMWRGTNTTVSFDFTIRNEGTAELKIKAKGGG